MIMSCCGKHTKERGLPDMPRPILPSDECVLCAEKHLSTAYSLAQERGYADANRQYIVGELVLAQWHLWHVSIRLAEIIRGIRHQIQMRQEAAVQWGPVLAEMDALATSEAKKLLEDGK
jgi:hypothetical protein